MNIIRSTLLRLDRSTGAQHAPHAPLHRAQVELACRVDAALFGRFVEPPWAVA